MSWSFVIYEMVIFSKSHIFTLIQHLWKYLNLGGGSLITADFRCRNPYFSFQNKITIENIRPTYKI